MCELLRAWLRELSLFRTVGLSELPAQELPKKREFPHPPFAIDECMQLIAGFGHEWAAI